MNKEKTKKNYTPIIFVVIICFFLIVLGASYSYISSGGVLAIHGEKELTANILNQENPFEVEESVKECTFLTGRVTGFSSENKNVEITIPNQPENTYIYAYLPIDQSRTLTIGKEVKIRGRFDYDHYRGATETTYIHIGDATNFFVFGVKATIVE